MIRLCCTSNRSCNNIYTSYTEDWQILNGGYWKYIGYRKYSVINALRSLILFSENQMYARNS